MKRNFPNFIEAFREYTSLVGAPDKFIKWSAISGIAACLERKVWIMYNGSQYVYPNLFVMLIAESGIANKTTASTPITTLLQEVKDLSFMSAQMSGASLIQQLKQAGEKKKFHYKGETYANSSVFSYSSEAKVTIGSGPHLGGIQELLTDFYDCGAPPVWSNKKGWTKTLISGEQIVFNPCLNILYCSTPTWLLQSIGKNGIEGGFASRCLFVNLFEPQTANLEWKDEEDIAKVDNLEFKNKLVEDLNVIAKLQGEYKVGKGFKDAYNAILKDRQENLRTQSEMRAYYARKMWHCLKIAQVLTANTTNDMIIKPETLEEANEYLKELEIDMYKPFGVAGDSTLALVIKKIMNVCKDKQAVSKKEIMSALWRDATPKQLDEAIQALCTMGKLRLNITGAGIGYIVITTDL